MAWLYVNRDKVDVTVAVAPAEPFRPIQAKQVRKTLYNAGGRRAETDVDLTGSRLIATTSIREGEIITQGEYVKLGVGVGTVFQVVRTEFGANQLALQAGDTVSLVFPGAADYTTDPECQALRESGVARLVSARVVIPPDGSGRMVVGASARARVAVQCFGVEGVTLVRRP